MTPGTAAHGHVTLLMRFLWIEVENPLSCGSFHAVISLTSSLDFVYRADTRTNVCPVFVLCACGKAR